MEELGSIGPIGVIHRDRVGAAWSERRSVLVQRSRRQSVSERTVGAGAGYEKRRWTRIFAISPLTITPKTRRSVRTPPASRCGPSARSAFSIRCGRSFPAPQPMWHAPQSVDSEKRIVKRASKSGHYSLFVINYSLILWHVPHSNFRPPRPAAIRRFSDDSKAYAQTRGKTAQNWFPPEMRSGRRQWKQSVRILRNRYDFIFIRQTL